MWIQQKEKGTPMFTKATRDFLRGKTTTAQATTLGARTGADPALATQAELLPGVATTIRGFTAAVLRGYCFNSGATGTRPTTATVGYCFYDTTLSKPVWLKTAPSTWVDATGTTV